MNSVKLELVGGLGNQLFGVAAGLLIQKKFNLECEFIYPNLGMGNESHGISLDGIEVFGHPIRVRPASPTETIRLSLSSRLDGQILKTFVEQRRGIIWDLETIRPGTLIRGYFQTSDAWRGLRNDGLMDSWPFNGFEDVFQPDFSNSAFVHLRFGDYRKSKSHQINQASYYRLAIELLFRNKPETTNLVLISDDIESATQLIESVVPYKQHLGIVGIDPSEVNALDALGLMSHFSAGIISNSTFALWGALFGEQSKYIIFPRPWFMDESLIKPEVCDAWIPVDYLNPYPKP